MPKILEMWLLSHKIKVSVLAGMLGCTPSTIHCWLNNKSAPRPAIAWKLHKITNGLVPISIWGYYLDGRGKIKKLGDSPIPLPTLDGPIEKHDL